MIRAALHRIIARSPGGVRRILKRVPGMSRLRDRLYGIPAGPDPVTGELRPVVYLPTWLSWEVMRQRPQYLLDAFAAAGHDVWFVDPRLDRPVTVSERVRLVPSVRQVPARGVILYVHFAPLQTLFDRFEDPVVIYDLLDDLEIYEANERGMAPERTVAFHHSSVMARADLVIVSNPVLLGRHRSEREDLILVENGVDLARFDLDGPVAPELPEGRLVGFHGAVAPWIDLDLIEGLAKLRPELDFALVGPIDPEMEDAARPLLQAENVHWIPAQPSHRIAQFVRGFSVGLLPFRVGSMTEAVTPLKMYEYLACGVPPVATPLPACVEHPAVRVGSDAEEFAEQVDAALQAEPGEKERLRGYAEEANWSHRLAPVVARLESLGLRAVV